MSDTATSPPLDPSAAWLAAYALGLAYSENSDQQRLSELLAAAQGCPELLNAAHQRLNGADAAERKVCDDALRLLDRARARVGPDL
ncbi:MAG: hypothetical protein EA388_03450 [Nitriliruptor sp.]|nr:MAG: hypothetical protein EA388_03450 [Nitriliruptor sp.]